jgi:uncharacterized protein YbjT (DUF2867 family)
MGASGHVGKIIAEHLLQTGSQVRVIGRGAERLKGLVDQGAISRTGEFHDEEMLAGAFTGVDGVFAMIPPDYFAPDHLPSKIEWDRLLPARSTRRESDLS